MSTVIREIASAIRDAGEFPEDWFEELVSALEAIEANIQAAVEHLERGDNGAALSRLLVILPERAA